MNYELIYFALLIVGATCLVIGVLLGSNLKRDIRSRDDDVGDLVIVPGDAGEQPYLFLELAVTPDFLEQDDHVVLRVLKLETRENHGA